MTTATTPDTEARCPKCECCTIERSQRGLCGACNINEECETCLTLDR